MRTKDEAEIISSSSSSRRWWYINREEYIELTIHSPVAGGTTSGARSRRGRCMAEAGVQQRREQQVGQQSEPRRQRAHDEQ